MSPLARTLLTLALPLVLFAACVAPDDAPVGAEGQVVRELRAPLELAWRETVASIHELGIVVPHDQRPDLHAGSIRTEELRVDLERVPASSTDPSLDLLGADDALVRSETTRATVLFYDRDPLRARVRGDSLLDTIEDRLDLRAR